jgi:SAM-dependent methyltransferase
MEANKTTLQGEEEKGPRLALEPSTLKLITIGRTTGLPHIAVVRFVVSEGRYFVIGGSRKSDWFLNALASKSGKVRVGDALQDMACEEFADTESVRTLFAKKYGTRVVEDWYSGPLARSLVLTPTGSLVVRRAIRGEGEVKLDFRAWKSQGLDYRGAVAEAFDSASEEYDFTIGSNFINVWIRERSIEAVLGRARPDDVLLEIGCGTGTEAIRISKHVRGVVATDISSKMVSLLRRKIEARRLGHKIQALQVRAIDVGRAKDHLPGGRARVAYSFNGALNCELEIQRFPLELWKVLEPGGLFICSIRNRFCLEESLVQGALLRFRSLTPRKGQPKMVSVGGMDIPAYYYYPREFANMFKPYFRARKLAALPAIMPPPYLNDLYVRLRPRLRLLEHADVALAGVFPFNRFGDQTLYVFERDDHASPEGVSTEGPEPRLPTP